MDVIDSGIGEVRLSDVDGARERMRDQQIAHAHPRAVDAIRRDWVDDRRLVGKASGAARGADG